MNALAVALIGATVGAIVAGVVAWMLQKRKVRTERNWNISTGAAEILGAILSTHTPNMLRTTMDVKQLEEQWAIKARSLGFLGVQPCRTGGRARVKLDSYFQALHAYVRGEMPRGALEHIRRECRDEIEEEIFREWR